MFSFGQSLFTIWASFTVIVLLRARMSSASGNKKNDQSKTSRAGDVDSDQKNMQNKEPSK